jgi:transcription antitermination factor NusG
VENSPPGEKGGALETAQCNSPGPDVSIGALASDDLKDRHWFAVRTVPRHEKKFAHHCLQRGVEHYLPLWRVRRTWNDGSRVDVELPLFSGYVFVRINLSRRVKILQIPGSLYFVVGTGHEPAPLPEEELEALRLGLHIRRAEPHPLLVKGRRARIRSGALTGMEGVVLRVANGYRLVLTVDLVMQSIAVEVDRSDLEPLESTPLQLGRVCQKGDSD